MKQNNHTADFAGKKPLQEKKKLTRAEKRDARKARKEAILPIHKRPIVCPPDKASRSPFLRIMGLVCRSLVIWLAAAGLMIFISSALELGVPNSAIFLSALITVTLVTLFRWGALGKVISILGAGGTLGGLVAVNPSLPLHVFYGILTVYNAALDRLYKVGYLAYVRYKVDIPAVAPKESLMTAGVCLITILMAVMFTACLVKKVRLIPPAILATTVLVVLLTFNIYSNRIESNLGITLVIVSFASVLVMAAYDRLYHGKNKGRYDSGMTLFEDDDRPTLPPDYKSGKEGRRARKAQRKEALDAASKKALKKTHKALHRQARAVKSYDRVTEQSRRAMGGVAAAAVLLTCLVAIALPSLFIKSNFSTIQAIDEKMELARNYVTALLRGDDDELDRLEYQADNSNFKPHSTTLEQLEFTGMQVFFLQSRYDANYYLRGWIGTDYENGTWLAVDDELLKEYQSTFGKKTTPAETIRYGFYHYMKPELVDDPAYTEHLLDKYKSNKEYGFVGLLVSIRRVNSPDTLTYFPTTFDPRYGLMEYNSTEPHEISFANFFDGLYTGRNFDENGLSYATMTYATVMTDKSWINRQAALQAAYSLQKEALLANASLVVNEDGSISSYLTLVTEEQANGSILFSYQYKMGKEERVWQFYHDASTVTRNGNRGYVVKTDHGTLTLSILNGKIVSATVTDVGSEQLDSQGTPVDVNLVDEYDRNMTDEERAALLSYLNTEKSYTDFAYKTYMDTSDSPFIRELAATIKAQAHVEEKRTYQEFVPDDPETPEEDSYTITHRETVNVPADVSLAAIRNSSDADVYVQRDLLVRNVIDYIIDEMGCTYTITPNLTGVDASLDGVENFLRNTKEGYCVQFASAVTLILRELGIPARYVEGYIADEMERQSRNDFVYGGYVRDYNAHAWVEVYYDGVGWIQYETTPQYYTGMYGAESSAGSTPVTPVLPEPETTTPEDWNEPETDPEETLPEDSTETENEEDLLTAEITRNSLIGLAILAVIVAIGVVIGTIISRARAAEDHRQSLCAQVLESGFGHNTDEDDRHEMALELTDAVTNLLSYYGLSPKVGEFRDDFADRLTTELTSPEEGKPQAAKAKDLPALHAALNGMAAEEFGHGMSISEMKQVAALYLFLRTDIKRRIPFPERMVLRYIKRKI